MKRLAILLTLVTSPAMADGFSDADSGALRFLDKLTGQTGDMILARGQSASNGRLTIQLDECRYPTEDPASDAQAHLTVMDSTRKDPVFSGWMLASSPALSALDHPRYDVWVLRCVVPGYEPPDVTDSTDDGEGE